MSDTLEQCRMYSAFADIASTAADLAVLGEAMKTSLDEKTYISGNEDSLIAEPIGRLLIHRDCVASGFLLGFIRITETASSEFLTATPASMRADEGIPGRGQNFAVDIESAKFVAARSLQKQIKFVYVDMRAVGLLFADAEEAPYCESIRDLPPVWGEFESTYLAANNGTAEDFDAYE